MTTDLFQQGTEGTKATEGQTGKMPVPVTPAAQFLRNRCECERAGRPMGWRFVQHYEIVRCVCGVWYWALQPKRGGPLVAFTWPGVGAYHE